MKRALEHYVEQWNLSRPEPLARTFTSDLYKVQASGETAVLKILSETGAEDERAAADALQWYDGQGAIQLWRHDAGAMLLEYAEGGDLSELVKAGRDDEATKIIAGVLNNLHSVSQSEFPSNLTPLLRRFQSLFEKAGDDHRQGARSLFVRGAAVARELLTDQGPPHVLHGDIHHENIRQAGRGWLAIDPKGLVGDRAYDAANALCNPHPCPRLCRTWTG
ncbi:aminoglycoside phosphotransferase family protein [Acidisoma sp. L85]|uniref:aminoglycoside phosphotransferase family protein n=1 Tax=Acidisoma sp. L85 TaxID=1641850 RepID=UPI00131BDB23|nr:aminoglycoside phosphotransferase family protein [Acidisoma sp. L85]